VLACGERPCGDSKVEEGEVKCKKCSSENLEIIDNGPHKELVCVDCMAFQKFISQKETIRFRKIEKIRKSKKQPQAE